MSNTDTGEGRRSLLRAPRQADFSTRLRNEAVTSRVGVWLGICFTIAFLTGLWSHFGQDIPGWLAWPTSPSWGYRFTQGLHVTAGTAAIPLLLVKLWSVYPRLFQAVPRRLSGTALLNGLERGSIGVLVASAIFQLVTGLMNSSQWYPWEFSFRSAHYALAWVAIGSLAIHIAVKLPIIRRALSGSVDDDHHHDDHHHDDDPGDGPAGEVSARTTVRPEDRSDPDQSGLGQPDPDEPADQPTDQPTDQPAGQLNRRGLLRTTWAAVAVALVAAGGSGTLPWLGRLSVFGIRTGEGPQGVPINRTAETAGVLPAAADPQWRLTVVNGDRTTELTRAQLEQMSQHTASLPIACVEGWGASAVWTGVPMADLLALVDAPAESDVFVTSLQQQFSFGTSELPANVAAHPDTMLALQLHGETLHIDHGYPCRVIAPNRPGVWQTKWVSRLEVLT